MIVIDGVEMVDVHEAARLADRSPETVRRWVWSGKVEAVKQGNKLFVPRSAVPAEPDVVVEPSAQDAFEAWARRVLDRAERATPRGDSAADLVLEDRDERAGR